jgi:copper homeostasis protein
MDHTLEIIGFNIESCIKAQMLGAGRIELCDGPSEGGTTPSYGLIKSARSKLRIELFPIIRPRGGDFLYSDDEFRIMEDDIKLCKKLDCDGIVTGLLNSDGTVDAERCKKLVELAYPMEVTFHRAFDRTPDPFAAMEDIIQIGCGRILTSGQEQHAIDGAALIAQLIQQANNRIVIMPGSGVRSTNIEAIASLTKATEFHSSARIYKESGMLFTPGSLKENLLSVAIDENEIKLIKQILTAF